MIPPPPPSSRLDAPCSCARFLSPGLLHRASDKCQREKRKTINGDDLLWAMSTLGFEEYVEPLKVYLHRYRESEGEKASAAKEGKAPVSSFGALKRASALARRAPYPAHNAHATRLYGLSNGR